MTTRQPIYSKLIFSPYISKKVRGFIVNTHDAMNYDIDIEFPNFLKEKYFNTFKTEYVYKQYDQDFMENPVFTTKKIHKSIAHRCRLRGIITVRSVTYSVMNEIKQLFDRLDGKVYCSLGNIDDYNRILVDIFFVLPECHDFINLKDYLVNLPIPENPFAYFKSNQVRQPRIQI